MRTERGRRSREKEDTGSAGRQAGRLFLSISHPLAHSLAFMRKIGAQLWPLDLLLQDGVAPKAPLSNKLDMQQKGLPSCSPCLRKPRKEPIIPADPVPLYVRIKSITFCLFCAKDIMKIVYRTLLARQSHRRAPIPPSRSLPHPLA